MYYGEEIFSQNLNYGTMVPGSSNQANDAVAEKYCYNDDPTMCDKYGGLYQWAEALALPASCNTAICSTMVADQHQGLCPVGWHILKATEWVGLTSSFVGDEASYLKSQDGGWKDARNGFDDLGFSAVPAGYRGTGGGFSPKRK